jgi:Lrp/AsnC family transcriptional regulator
MDLLDIKLLKILQEDCTLPLAELARRVNLSSTPCWRRVQNLKEDGVIRKQVALLDAAKLNAGVTVFVSVRTNQHNASWLDKFAKVVRDIPEVVEFYRMSGEMDYLLRVVVPGIAGYDAVYQKLIRAVEIYDVTSSFAMEKIKDTTALPLDYVL